jgi:hypothetical protein
LRQLAAHEDYTVRALAASDEGCPPDVLSVLAGDPREYVRGLVAANANTPPAVLAVLARDSSTWVRRNVASNVNTPVSALVGLVDGVLGVGQDLAERDDLSADVLVLYPGLDAEFAEDIALRNLTSLSVLHSLADHPSAAVRFAVLCHQDAPTTIVERVWHNRIRDGLETMSDTQMGSFASHRATPDDIFEAVPTEVAYELNPTRLSQGADPDLVETFAPGFAGSVRELYEMCERILAQRS